MIDTREAFSGAYYCVLLCEIARGLDKKSVVPKEMSCVYTVYCSCGGEDDDDEWSFVLAGRKG